MSFISNSVAPNKSIFVLIALVISLISEVALAGREWVDLNPLALTEYVSIDSQDHKNEFESILKQIETWEEAWQQGDLSMSYPNLGDLDKDSVVANTNRLLYLSVAYEIFKKANSRIGSRALSFLFTLNYTPLPNELYRHMVVALRNFSAGNPVEFEFSMIYLAALKTVQRNTDHEINAIKKAWSTTPEKLLPIFHEMVAFSVLLADAKSSNPKHEMLVPFLLAKNPLLRKMSQYAVAPYFGGGDWKLLADEIVNRVVDQVIKPQDVPVENKIDAIVLLTENFRTKYPRISSNQPKELDDLLNAVLSENRLRTNHHLMKNEYLIRLIRAFAACRPYHHGIQGYVFEAAFGVNDPKVRAEAFKFLSKVVLIRPFMVDDLIESANTPILSDKERLFAIDIAATNLVDAPRYDTTLMALFNAIEAADKILKETLPRTEFMNAVKKTLVHFGGRRQMRSFPSEKRIKQEDKASFVALFDLEARMEKLNHSESMDVFYFGISLLKGEVSAADLENEKAKAKLDERSTQMRSRSSFVLDGMNQDAVDEAELINSIMPGWKKNIRKTTLRDLYDLESIEIPKVEAIFSNKSVDQVYFSSYLMMLTRLRMLNFRINEIKSGKISVDQDVLDTLERIVGRFYTVLLNEKLNESKSRSSTFKNPYPNSETEKNATYIGKYRHYVASWLQSPKEKYSNQFIEAVLVFLSKLPVTKKTAEQLVQGYWNHTESGSPFRIIYKEKILEMFTENSLDLKPIESLGVSASSGEAQIGPQFNTESNEGKFSLPSEKTKVLTVDPNATKDKFNTSVVPENRVLDAISKLADPKTSEHDRLRIASGLSDLSEKDPLSREAVFKIAELLLRRSSDGSLIGMTQEKMAFAFFNSLSSIKGIALGSDVRLGLVFSLVTQVDVKTYPNATVRTILEMASTVLLSPDPTAVENAIQSVEKCRLSFLF